MADWTWQPMIDDDIARKGVLLSAALTCGAVGCVAGALIGSARYLVIVGLMLAGLVWLGRSATNQLRSLRVSVDGGMATFIDSRHTTTVDLRTVDLVNVSSRGDFLSERRWAIEAVGAGTAIEHRIANVEQYWSLGEDQIAELRRGLQHYHDWYRAKAAPPSATPSAGQPAAFPPFSGIGATKAFEWCVPRHENADRNRRRVGVITLLLALSLAAAGVVSSWGDTLGVILSIVVLPGLIGLLGGGLWWAYIPAQRFRLTVTGGVLLAHGAYSSKPAKEVRLAGATRVKVDTSTSLVATGTGSHTRSTTTYIWIEHAEAGGTRVTIPGGPGSAMNAEQRLLLESQLRRLAGLA